jgi:hypothetical protein
MLSEEKITQFFSLKKHQPSLEMELINTIKYNILVEKPSVNLTCRKNDFSSIVFRLLANACKHSHEYLMESITLTLGGQKCLASIENKNIYKSDLEEEIKIKAADTNTNLHKIFKSAEQIGITIVTEVTHADEQYSVVKMILRPKEEY